MKKMVMIIGLMLVLVTGVFAQVTIAGKTYYYRYVETVNPNNGVRSKEGDKGMYITFTGNSCYISDEKGIKTKDGYVCIYQGEQNNLLVFICKFNNVSNSMYPELDRHFDETWTYTYSKDYKRINIRYQGWLSGFKGTEIQVWEQANPPSPSSKSPDFY